MVRQYEWPEYVREMEKEAWAMGAAGISSGHTCPDLEIGLTQGWGGILDRIIASRQKYERLDNQPKASYLRGLQMICESVIRFIQRHSDRAYELAAQETDPWQKETYLRIARCCANIAYDSPKTYYEGVQWIHFAVMMDRVVGHGNGYGRLDLYLIDLYRKSKAVGELSDEEAREYISEMFLKLRGHFFSMGGRDANLKDATNEMSFVVLEAYDLIGDYNNIGVMWHPDINPEFYDYCLRCAGAAWREPPGPGQLRLDVRVRTALGHPPRGRLEGGLQWLPVVLHSRARNTATRTSTRSSCSEPMKRTIAAAVERGISDFESFYALFEEELTVTARWLRDWKNTTYELLGSLWPEMYTSMISHGPIERGIDMVDNRGVDYQFSSVNILGIPNVADSFHAIKKLVFEKKMYTLQQVKEAIEATGKAASRCASASSTRTNSATTSMKSTHSSCASPSRWPESWAAWSTCAVRSSGLPCSISRVI